MKDYTDEKNTHEYPNEWLRTREEAKEMERVDDEMRKRIKKTLQERKK